MSGHRDPNADTAAQLDELLRRCTFPATGREVTCAFSGGPDSTALLILARRAGLRVVAHHVDHGIRPESTDEAECARSLAGRLDVPFQLHRVEVDDGPNLEARARAARLAALPEDAMTGHTADDQAETVLLRLLRGSGSTGLGGIRPGTRHPILAIRRSETHRVCAVSGVTPVRDASNDQLDMWRNRLRAEVVPLLTDIAGRDLTPILNRSAELLRQDSDFLDQLASAIDPTDARSIAETEPVLARRALRQWLAVDGYPPDADSIERVLAVARGDAVACELPGGRRIRRSKQRLHIAPDDVE